MLVSVEPIDMAGSSLDHEFQALPALALRGRKEPVQLFGYADLTKPHEARSWPPIKSDVISAQSAR